MSTLRLVKVKRTVYTLIKVPLDMKQYIDDCVETGGLATLFKDPKITAIFYGLGTAASKAIKDAIDTYALTPTTPNLNAIKDKMALGVIWLNLYADQVQVIANLDINRTTRAEAATNIGLSFLTPQKLAPVKKGNPEPAVITGKSTGNGNALLEITNGDTYNPSLTNFIAVQLPEAGEHPVTDPIVTLVNGNLRITNLFGGEVVFQSANGKGKFTNMLLGNPGARYAIYAYAQNGKKQVSLLSIKIILTA